MSRLDDCVPTPTQDDTLQNGGAVFLSHDPNAKADVVLLAGRRTLRAAMGSEAHQFAGCVVDVEWPEFRNMLGGLMCIYIPRKGGA